MGELLLGQAIDNERLTVVTALQLNAYENFTSKEASATRHGTDYENRYVISINPEVPPLLTHNFVAEVGCIVCRKEFVIYYNIMKLDFDMLIRKHYAEHIMKYASKHGYHLEYIEDKIKWNKQHSPFFVLFKDEKKYLFNNENFTESLFKVISLKKLSSFIINSSIAEALWTLNEDNTAF